MRENDLTTRLREYWHGKSVFSGAGVTDDAISRFENHFGVLLPTDMLSYFKTINGTLEMDHEGFKLWPLVDVVPLRDITTEASAQAVDHLFAFADHLIMAWVYAIRLSDRSRDVNCAVIESNGLKVADSFSEFVDLYISNSPKLFP